MKAIDISAYTYHLDEDRIAKYPLENRDESKLLIYKNDIRESVFSAIHDHIPPGSKVFFNNTRVIHARLQFYKPSGARIEIFCLSPVIPAEYSQAFSAIESCTWKCMVGNNKKWKSGTLELTSTINGKKVILQARKVESEKETHQVEFSWSCKVAFGAILDALGNIPIPPYLKRDSEQIDTARYQTVYSSPLGSVAAPTAGLHFTGDVLDRLKKKGIETDELTLHVGAGTFQPVKSEDARLHQMHTETFSVDSKLIAALAEHSDSIVATGTTTMRTLESLYWLALKSIHAKKVSTQLNQWENETINNDYSKTVVFSKFSQLLEKKRVSEFTAQTSIMIVPGYQFQVVNGLITNFHQPKSTLLLLIAAFIGENWKEVYSYALNNNFRFLSYGDSSLLWR